MNSVFHSICTKQTISLSTETPANYLFCVTANHQKLESARQQPLADKIFTKFQTRQIMIHRAARPKLPPIFKFVESSANTRL